MFFFVEIRTEDGGIGVHRQDGGKAERRPPFTEDCLGGLLPWWFQDADGARRCRATGLIVSNVCIMDRKHGPVQLDAVGSTPNCLQHTNFASCRWCQQSTMECFLHEAEATNKLDMLSDRPRSTLKMLAAATPFFARHSLTFVANGVAPRLWTALLVQHLLLLEHTLDTGGAYFAHWVVWSLDFGDDDDGCFCAFDGCCL